MSKTINFGGKKDSRAHAFMTTFGTCLIFEEIDGVPMTFNSLEAYVNYHRGLANQKENAELLVKIHGAIDPSKAKYFASKKAGFTDDPDWDKKPKGSKMTKGSKVILRGLKLKYGQNPILAAALMHTGKAKLVYNAPWDDQLGNGKDGDGKNRLGKMTEKVRKELATGKLGTTLDEKTFKAIKKEGL